MGDIAQRRVLVCGDSVMRGLEKIFQKQHGCRAWRVDANCGQEALSLPCTNLDLASFDHVIYCSAGNAMWKGDKVWKAVETNVASFDPSKVSVLLLGSVPFWQRIAGAHYKPERYSFFEDA